MKSFVTSGWKGTRVLTSVSFHTSNVFLNLLPWLESLGTLGEVLYIHYVIALELQKGPQLFDSVTVTALLPWFCWDI